jgi:hypothetical protein
MSFLTTVPVILGKGINVWLGLVLLAQIGVQLSSGVVIYKNRGNIRLIAYHRLNAIALSVVVFIHAYYGIGIWFLGFQYGR